MRSLNSCQTNGFWWLYPPASSSTSWASRVSPGYVWLVFCPLFLWCEPLHSPWCVVVCRQAGIYWVTLIDQFVASWVLLFLTLFEIIGVCYIYGTRDPFGDVCTSSCSGDRLSSCLRRRKPLYWRHRNDARKKELRVLAVVESLLVLHQSSHHSGGCNANHRCHGVLWRRAGFYYVCELLNIHRFVLGEKKVQVLNNWQVLRALKVSLLTERHKHLCHRWSWSGLWWPSPHLPTEERRSQAGAWLWAGAWQRLSSSGSPPSQAGNCWERRETSGRSEAPHMITLRCEFCELRDNATLSHSLSAWRRCALPLKTGIPSWTPIEESDTPKRAAKPEGTIQSIRTWSQARGCDGRSSSRQMSWKIKWQEQINSKKITWGGDQSWRARKPPVND